MQITGSNYIARINTVPQSGNNMPTETSSIGNTQPNKSPISEIPEPIDPKNMSRKESMDLANTLMKAGEGDLSTAFLPTPLLRVNSDGSVVDLAGTPEGERKMNEKFNMFDSLKSRIEYNKSINEPTKLLEDAYSFLEKFQVAQNTPSINEYT